VLIDTGLGVGVDFGSASLVKVADGLTVVGAPVVYACRLSGAPPGTTLLNQPAYEKLNEQFGHLCFVEESELQIKHEGAILAYSVKPNGARYQPAAPPWAASPNAAATETPPTPGAET
jgi:class 3 adenylate cyclase